MMNYHWKVQQMEWTSFHSLEDLAKATKILGGPIVRVELLANQGDLMGQKSLGYIDIMDFNEKTLNGKINSAKATLLKIIEMAKLHSGPVTEIADGLCKIRTIWDDDFEKAWQGLKGDHSKISVHIIDEMYENDWITTKKGLAVSDAHRGNYLTEKGKHARDEYLKDGTTSA